MIRRELPSLADELDQLERRTMLLTDAHSRKTMPARAAKRRKREQRAQMLSIRPLIRSIPDGA